VTSPYLPGRPVRTLAEQKRPWQLVWAIYYAVCVTLIVTLREPGRWVGVALLWVPVLHNWNIKRLVARYNREAAPAVDALHRALPAVAEPAFVALRDRYRWPRSLHTLASYNLGLARFRQGKLDDAIAALVEADQRGGGVTIDAALASTLALLHAVKGDLTLAEPWLAEAQRRYAGRATATRFPSLQSEIAVALRRGEFDQVTGRLDRDWIEIESTSKGESVRPLRALRAFAIARAAPHDEAAAAAQLAALQPRPGEFIGLTAAWPELAKFLEAPQPALAAT
jgi:hypothetical protein